MSAPRHGRRRLQFGRPTASHPQPAPEVATSCCFGGAVHPPRGERGQPFRRQAPLAPLRSRSRMSPRRRRTRSLAMPHGTATAPSRACRTASVPWISSYYSPGTTWPTPTSSDDTRTPLGFYPPAGTKSPCTSPNFNTKSRMPFGRRRRHDSPRISAGGLASRSRATALSSREKAGLRCASWPRRLGRCVITSDRHHDPLAITRSSDRRCCLR